jgi:hypothetical protein
MEGLGNRHKAEYQLHKGAIDLHAEHSSCQVSCGRPERTSLTDSGRVMSHQLEGIYGRHILVDGLQ